MRKRFSNGGLAVAAALLCVSAVWAAPSIAQADSAARKAFELKQYSVVVKSYEDVDPLLLSEHSFYRLAIAHQRMGNSVEAKKALDQAMAKNPTGLFASSPARLELLQLDIQRGIAKSAQVIYPNEPMGRAILGTLAAGASKTVLPTELAITVASEHPTIATVAPVVPAVTTAPLALALKVALGDPADKPSVPVHGLVDVNAYLGSIALGLLAALVFSLCKAHRVRGKMRDVVVQCNLLTSQISELEAGAAQHVAAISSAKTEAESAYAQANKDFKTEVELVKVKANEAVKHIAQNLHHVEITSEARQLQVALLKSELAEWNLLKSKPVSDVGDLVALRNELTKLRELIVAAGTTDSLLFKAIRTLEPVVEMEIGRNHFRLSRDASVLVSYDRKKLASVMQLEPTPMSLDAAEPQEVMSYISSRSDRFLSALGLKDLAAEPVL